jgi:hypothetical protein
MGGGKNEIRVLYFGLHIFWLICFQQGCNKVAGFRGLSLTSNLLGALKTYMEGRSSEWMLKACRLFKNLSQDKRETS